MHDHMSAMMAQMQKNGGMMGGGMMGKQKSGDGDKAAPPAAARIGRRIYEDAELAGVDS
jgi:hypothetical protein